MPEKFEKALPSLQIQLAVGIAFGSGESKLRQMNAFIVVVATLAAILACTFAVAATSAESVSNLQAKVDDAKRDVSRAQTKFDQAREKACSTMSPTDKAQWQQAEAKFESALAVGSDDQIEMRKAAVEGIESRVTKDGDRKEVDAARDKLIAAQARLNEAKTRLAADTRGTNNHDESSQAIQPENRTQNGNNFSIRSQRDSENHPPLPASQ